MADSALGCNAVRKLLYDYISDIPDSDTKKAIELHIKSCPECSRELEKIQSIINTAALIDDIEPPSELYDSVFSQIRGEAPRSAPRRRLYIKAAIRYILPAAACAVLAVGIYSSGLYEKFTASDDIITSGDNTEIISDSNNSNAEIIPESEFSATTENNQSETAAPNTGEKNVSKKTEGHTVKTPALNADITSSHEDGNIQENTVSAVTGDTSAVEAPAPMQDEEASADSKSNAHRASGGGSSSKSENAMSSSSSGSAYKYEPMPKYAAEDIQADTDEVYNSFENSIQAYSGGSFEASEALDSTAGASASNNSAVKKSSQTIPSSCTVSADDPIAFANGFGADAHEENGVVRFTISRLRWQDFVSYNQTNNHGAALGESYSDADDEAVEIIVYKK